MPECTNKGVINRGTLPNSKNCFGTSVAHLQARSTKERELLFSKFSDNVKTYNVMWECNWKQFKSENQDLVNEVWSRSKLDPLRPLYRLIPRVSIRGGFLEVYRLSYQADDNNTLHFYDCNSMYSYIAAETFFPIGDYEIILENDLQQGISIKDNEIFYKNESCQSDIALVSILVPSDLKKPFLSYRLNDQTFNANCFSCLRAKKISPCRHKSDNKRRFVSVWTVIELSYCLSLGYKILHFYELYHYKESAKLLTDFVKVMASQKLKNSNLLANVPKQNQASYCRHLNAAMNFKNPDLELNPSNIKDNKSQKQFFKDILNSVYGRFSLHSNFSKRVFLRSQHELESLMANPSHEILEFFPVTESTMEVEYLKNAQLNPSKDGCLIYTALINAKSRVYMHKLIMKLEEDQCECLYCDTDSILFASPKNYSLPFTVGPCFGDFKAVLGESSQIKKFFSLGPRNYCVLYENGGALNYVTKIKGLSIASANLEKFITPATYETYLSDYFKAQVTQTYIPQMRKTINPQTKSFKYVMLSQKFDNELHLKRFILKHESTHKTYPYGYNFKNCQL